MLRQLGLEQYLAAFDRQGIDDDLLPDLTDADLREIGVTRLGDRKRILRFIKAQKDPAPDAPAEPDEQKRLVTVLFADLVGSTRISKAIDAEDMRRLIRAYHAIARDAADRFGGQIVQFLGDGIYACFGHPRAHENDPERAARMGLHLVSAIREMNRTWAPIIGWPLEIRVGIETGRVVVGGSEMAVDGQSILLTGEAPNVAAHLQGAAKPGSVLAGPQAAMLIADRVILAPDDTDLATGAPDGARTVIGLNAAVDTMRQAAGGSPGPFVGREHELRTLDDALGRVRAGQSVCVSIVGEPGIGKSRLVREFLDTLSSGTRILSGSCVALDSSAYHLIREVLRSRIGASQAAAPERARRRLIDEFDLDHPDLAAHAPYLLHLAGLATDEDEIQPDLLAVRARDGMAELLRHAGELLPTVVVLNDLHWIDERSEQVLSHFIARTDCRGVLFLCTYRQRYRAAWQDLPQVRHLALKPLAEDAAARLFAELAGPDADVSGDVISNSGGNPYFIQELARIAGQSRTDAASPYTVPMSLNGLLQERIDRLGPAALDLIRAASAVGQEFDPDDLARPGSSRDLAMAELLERGYIVEDGQGQGRFRFIHALLQAAVYDGIVREDLIRIHTRIAYQIEERAGDSLASRSEELARHLEIAGDDLKAARYAFLSGSKANAVFALKDAAHWFETTLRLLPDKLSEQDAKMRRKAIAELIYVRCWSADFKGMVSLADTALAELDAGDLTPEIAQFRTWTAEAYVHTFRLSEAEALLNAVLSAGADTLPEEVRLLALGQYGWLCSLRPVPGEGTETAERMAELARLCEKVEEALYPSVMLNYARASSAMHLGDYGNASLHADALIELGERRGYPPATCWGHCFHAFVAADAGHDADAMPHFEAAAHSALSRFDQLAVELCRGAALYRLDRPDEALELLEGLHRRVPEVGAFHFSHLAIAAQGHAKMLGGESDGAEILRAGAEKFEAKGYDAGAAVLLAHLGDALLRTGQTGQAVDVLDDARNRSERLGMRRVQAESLAGLGTCLVEFGQDQAAAKAFEEALELAKATDWFPLERRLRQLQRQTVRG